MIEAFFSYYSNSSMSFVRNIAFIIFMPKVHLLYKGKCLIILIKTVTFCQIEPFSHNLRRKYFSPNMNTVERNWQAIYTIQYKVCVLSIVEKCLHINIHQASLQIYLALIAFKFSSQIVVFKYMSFLHLYE